PEFDGRKCSEPGCERRLGLETDHVVPFSEGGPTSGENLADLCGPHHRAKSERDRRSGRARAARGDAERAPP
ncbi:MAG: HNH endonuclease signature motif containing protein, partial [Acidimicrobiia bacterium]